MFRQNGTHLRVEFHLDRTSPISLDRQIAQTVREAVQKGLLQPGDRIVPIRLLAKHLGVARATVDSAFAILIAEGYLETSRGAAVSFPQNCPCKPISTSSPATCQTLRR